MMIMMVLLGLVSVPRRRHSTTTWRSPNLFPLLLLLVLSPMAFAFNFTTPLQQCANITMAWFGGVAPYEILLVPIGHLHPEIRTIINYQGINTTSFSFPLTFPAQSQFVAILSDSASGPGSGGTSGILTVDAPAHDDPTSASACLATQQTKPAFYFYLEPATPVQCEPWQVAWPLTALSAPPAPAPPQHNISVWAVVPDGPTFALDLPAGVADLADASLDCATWDVDLPAGTSVLLVAGYEYAPRGGVVNGRGKGGSTDIFVVGASNDSSCWVDNDPLTSTMTLATQTTTTTTTNTNTNTNRNSLSRLTTTTTTTTSTTTGALNSGNGGGANAAGRRAPISIPKLASALLAIALGRLLLS